MSFGGLAQLAAGRGESTAALDLYRQSLAAFEAVGDRGEVARILSEMAWACLGGGEVALARRYFFDSVQAHTDVASVRGVGLSLVGLAAAEAVEDRPERPSRSPPRRRSTPRRKASSSCTPTRRPAVSSSTWRERRSRPTKPPGPPRPAASHDRRGARPGQIGSRCRGVDTKQSVKGSLGRRTSCAASQ